MSCQLISSAHFIHHKSPTNIRPSNPPWISLADASLLRRCLNRDQQPPEYSNCLTTLQCCETGPSLDRCGSLPCWCLDSSNPTYSMQNGPELVVAMENAPGLKIHFYIYAFPIENGDFWWLLPCECCRALHPGRRPRTEAVVQRTVHVDDGCLEAPLKPGSWIPNQL